jgi:hypothetical protein
VEQRSRIVSNLRNQWSVAVDVGDRESSASRATSTGVPDPRFGLRTIDRADPRKKQRVGGI